MARLKVDPSALTAATASTNTISLGSLNVGNVSSLHSHGTMVAAAAAPTPSTAQSVGIHGSQLLGTIDCYDDVFKEITKKLYGDESGGVAIADVLDPSVVSSITAGQPIVYDAGDLFRQDATSGALTTNAGNGGLAIVTAPNTNGIPPGAILVQTPRRLQDEKGRIWTIEGLPNTGEQIAFATLATPTPGQIQTTTHIQPHPAPMQLQTTTMPPPQLVVAQQPQQPLHQQQLIASATEERWFESDEQLSWTQSKIARYNPTQKVFRCVDCDFIGFLSRVAEHWLGNHADLRVFQCPRCPYTSAWARCVRMHLTRQHGETLADNSLWKENPVLEEVTKFLNTLKTKVEQKNEVANANGEKRYICPYCPYQTDRRDLYNRHENIHRDEKPFQCYVCDKQFNRADHVKKHFIRIHREHPYDINKIKKAAAKGNIQFLNGSKLSNKQRQHQGLGRQQIQVQIPQSQQHLIQQGHFPQVQVKTEQDGLLLGTASGGTIAVQIQGQNQSATLQQIPHLAYFNPPTNPGQNGPLQGIPGVGGTKKETKTKGHKKKRSGEKMYTCSYCPWQGVDNWCLKRHLNTHIKPFLCALCDYKAARSERLATHVLKVHNKRVCHKCSFLADDTDGLSQHIQESHQNPLVKTGFNCNLCQEYFELRADLEAHAILEHQKVIVQCDLCDFRTTDELSMEAHLRDKHNLTPGMGAVAAAAAAAAAAAVGQPLNAQYLQSQSQQIQISEQIGPSGDILSQGQSSVPTQQLAGAASSTSTSQDMLYSTEISNNLHIAKVTGSTPPQATITSESAPEPETLCDKCGIDFLDEESRKLHERRHDLVNATEEESQKDGKTSPRLLRNYVCSTCSYTCATKKVMMQHQRAHSGFGLVCKAENCLFSTPFENTLKEHIQSEHGAEVHVRCPHCGLQMPSSSAFTSHWRFHHRTICSLCVNVYRVRYDVKENDIHDVICRAPNSPLYSHSQCDGTDVETSAVAADITSRLTADDSISQLCSSEVLSESPSKKPRLDISLGSRSSTASLYKRESIRFLPRLVEVIVAPASPKIKENVPSTRRRRRRGRHLGKRKGKSGSSNVEGNGATSLVPSGPGKKATNIGTQHVDMLLKYIARKETETVSGTGIYKISLGRRFCQKGTYPWLFRNPREGFKCLSPLCEGRRSWRYPRKSGLVLHKVWYHRIPRFKCDICGLQFLHLYKAVLHKMTQHEVMDLPQQPKNESLDQIQVYGLSPVHVIENSAGTNSNQSTSLLS